MQNNIITIDNSIKLICSLINESKNLLFIQISGYIDSYNCSSFIDEILKLTDSGYINLIFDCNELNYVSSTGIGSLASIIKELEPKDKICNIS